MISGKVQLLSKQDQTKLKGGSSLVSICEGTRRNEGD